MAFKKRDYQGRYKAVNWNEVNDIVDKLTWDKLNSQFWLDTRIPVSNDLDDWRLLSEKERDLVNKVFAGLTLLDTLQSQDAIKALQKHAITQHEVAVLNQIQLMESIHAKSYSTIFSTLNTKKEIEEIFEWALTNPYLQKKAEIVDNWYKHGNELQRRAISVMLESFLFYSGFFTPLYYLGQNKLVNCAEIIRLIIRDECLTSDHELLTINGWKGISEITLDDVIAQYDVESDSLSFVKPLNVSHHYETNVTEFSTNQNHINIACSPKHRFLTFANGKPIVETADEVKLNTMRHIKHTAEVKNEDIQHNSLTDVEKILIAINGAGSYPKDIAPDGHDRLNGDRTGYLLVNFSFTKQKHVDSLVELASKLNWKLNTKAVTPQKDNRQARHNFSLKVPLWYADKDKPLPKPSLNKVSTQWCKEFIEEVAHWDAHIVKNNPNRITYGSSNLEDVKYIQAIASLAGYRTQFVKKEYTQQGKERSYYNLQINKDRVYSGAQMVEQKELPSQTVYGVEVPSQFLLTRRNGSVLITGNSVHGNFIGQKNKIAMHNYTAEQIEEYKDWVYDTLMELYENEVKYASDLYDEIGWTEKVKTFMRYNANKALQNLGLDPLFGDTAEDVDPLVLNGISTGTTNHDFFSQVGNGYLLGEVEPMSDEDYNY